MTVGILFQLFGSLALLIYGMKLMSDSLQKMTGARLRNILGKMTSNRFAGMLTGTFVTCAVQSSSATTVMTVSFVSAGLLTLTQAISVIMGANIGTTLTAWIMSLGYNVDLTTVVFPTFIIGMVLIYKKRYTTIGDFLFGIAFLFWSLVMLSGVGKKLDLAHNPDVVNFFTSFDSNSYSTILIFLAAGTIITCIVQSSAAVMAITILLCSTGVMPIYQGIALVMGENIGTTATANLAALGARTPARRTALAHLVFNVFGVCWVLCIFYPFVDMVCNIVAYNPAEAGSQERLPVVLAMFHTCFNVLNTALLIGFIPQMERLVCKLMPEKRNDAEVVSTLHYIERGIITAPEISIMQAQKEIIHFAERMHRMLGMVQVLLDEKKRKDFTHQHERIVKYEGISDRMEIEIGTYLGRVSNEHLSDDTKSKIRAMLRQISELESIGDACNNIARIIKRRTESKEDFSEEQYTQLHEMFRLVNESMVQMIVVLGDRKNNLTIETSEDIEKDINSLKDKLKTLTIQEVNAHQHSYAIGSLYIDIVSECEKLADYVMNVVETILGKSIVRYKGLQINLSQKNVFVDGESVRLTRTEYELLFLLMTNRGKVFSRQQLMNSIWQGVIVTDRTVDVNIARMRKKLGPYAQHIASRQGFGYFFDETGENNF